MHVRSPHAFSNIVASSLYMQGPQTSLGNMVCVSILFAQHRLLSAVAAVVTTRFWVASGVMLPQTVLTQTVMSIIRIEADLLQCVGPIHKLEEGHRSLTCRPIGGLSGQSSHPIRPAYRVELLVEAEFVGFLCQGHGRNDFGDNMPKTRYSGPLGYRALKMHHRSPQPAASSTQQWPFR